MKKPHVLQSLTMLRQGVTISKNDVPPARTKGQYPTTYGSGRPRMVWTLPLGQRLIDLCVKLVHRLWRRAWRSGGQELYWEQHEALVQTNAAHGRQNKNEALELSETVSFRASHLPSAGALTTGPWGRRRLRHS